MAETHTARPWLALLAASAVALALELLGSAAHRSPLVLALGDDGATLTAVAAASLAAGLSSRTRY